MPLAWGKRVTESCQLKVEAIAAQLRTEADWLMAVMAFEGAEEFSPRTKNRAGSGATGPLQIMPETAIGLGTTVEALGGMDIEDYLVYVLKYFLPYKGRLNSLDDVYMAVLWPRAIGKPDNYPLFDRAKRPTTFRQNSGLDLDRNGIVTKHEAAAKIRAALTKGLRPENAS